MKHSCPNCKNCDMTPFYEVHQVPVHDVLLMESRKEAVNHPRRDMKLAFCPFCGFISNCIFDPEIHEYSAKYEETQGFSGTFSQFHQALAQQLIDKYHLYNKKILEIGCGKGEFITLLCELGNNRGYGFDPAFVPERNPDRHNLVEFVTDYYSEKYSHYSADMVCCKMTLEHIAETFDFVEMVRNAIGEDHSTIVFFQMPEALSIFTNLAFWDIYYEHCSYFSRVSLGHLFEATGFRILNLQAVFDGQYLTIEAKPTLRGSNHGNIYGSRKSILQVVKYFRKRVHDHQEQWKNLIDSYHRHHKKVILWGGSSKSVAFLTSLNITEEIEYVVDINPYKQGYFMPGSGQEVVSPSFLREYKPDMIIVMNPVYLEEIHQDLKQMNLSPDILPVDYWTKTQTLKNA